MARDYYDESKPKKKKKETPKPQKVTKSPSVTKVNNKASNSTFLGGGSSVKKVEKAVSSPAPKRTTTTKRTTMTDAQYQKTYGEPRRATAQRNQTAKPEPVRRTTNHRLTAAQTQKMYGTTNPKLQTAEESRREREERRKLREERRLAGQRQKSGLNDQPTAAQKAATDRALKNTLPIAKESAKGAAYGHLTTLNDIASIKSQGNGKSREEIYDPNLAERSRQQAEQRVKKYQAKTQETEDAIQKLTKNAKGLEKAYYGAVESGTGMLTDIGIGALTGTGQVGSLASMFSRTYGSTRGKAQQEGATEAEDRAYAAAQAAKEVGTELMFPGAGLARGYAGKQGLKLADTAANILTKNLRGKAADIGGAGVRLLGGVLEENAEEVAGWGLDPLIKEITYGKNARTRNAQQAMKERSNALRAEIQNEDDARAAAAYLSSDDFFEQTVNAYREAGLSKKDAEEVADRMRDYLTASLTGDTDSMKQIEDEVSKKVAGSKKLEWDFDELKDTIASTTLLTVATGLPGTGMTAVKGAALRDQLGDDGVRALANTAIDFEDGEMSLKAKAMKARLDSGNELTSTQVYDLQVGMQEQIRKDTQREESSRRMADKRIKSDNLLTPYRQNENGGIDLDEATEASYREHVSKAKDIIDGLTSETKESLTANEKVDGSKAIAGFQTGVFTIEDANTLNYSNTTVRAAFEEATGVDLGQYVVKNKDGSVNIPATNTKTKDALFAMAADNLVKSAQAETQNWMDNAKGQVVTQVSARMGASGSAVLQQALDDVDERDRSKYMMTANATDMLYQAARNMGTEWESIAPEATKMFPGISESKLKMMYEAGLADREMANDKARGRQVRMGQALTEMGEQETATGKVFIDTEVPVKGSVIKTFTEIAKNLGADIHFVDYIYDAENNPIEGANGSYDPNTNTFYLNVATGAETNIGYIFMHETTHYLKTYAPEQYQALENLVRKKWFAFNPSQMQDAIARKIEAYKRATKGQQVLTEERALEEIIADASHDFINDPEFARQVAEEDMGLAKAVLNSIRNALRMLRRIFASGSIDDDTHMNSLFKELDIMTEAEKLWLDAYKVAVQNSAINAVNTWQDETNEQSSFSLGYHAGDLGKSTVDDYAHQGGSRGSGHFGFGTYFVGDEEQINYGNYGKRKHEAVDFDKYNLFKPRNFDQGLKLHDALRTIDGIITDYSDFMKYKDSILHNEELWNEELYRTSTVNNDIERLVDEYEMDGEPDPKRKERIDKFISEMPEYYRENIEREAQKKYDEAQNREVDEDNIREYLTQRYELWGSALYDNVDNYVNNNLESEIRYINNEKEVSYEQWYYETAKDAINEYSEDWANEKRTLTRLADDLQRALNYEQTSSKIERALLKTEEIVKGYQPEGGYRLDAEPGLDSGATVFMKQLGYEGVDVRHIPEMDNTGYGSVIYDLKGEDLARKQEIGTARFSISEPVERVNDLIAVHNLKPEDIRNTFELGGFPMPSIAITKDSMGHDEYGDISLLFHSDTIDPEFFRSNQVFGGDAWTPTFPSIAKKVSRKVADKVDQRLRDILGLSQNDYTLGDLRLPALDDDNLTNALRYNDPYEAFKNDEVFQIAYLKNAKNYDVAVPTKEGRIRNLDKQALEYLDDKLPELTYNDIYDTVDHTMEYEPAVREARKAYYEAKGGVKLKALSKMLDEKMGYSDVIARLEATIKFRESGIPEVVDRDALKKILDENVDQEGYKAWIEDLFDGIIEKTGIRNDKDMFSPSGKRRTWEQLHDPVTLENVVKVMRAELAAGSSIFGGNPKGAAQKQYKSLDEIRADEDRLQSLPEEEYEALSKEAVGKMSEVCVSIAEHNPKRFSNSFGAALDVGSDIAEILNSTRKRSTIQSKLKRDYLLDVTDEQMDDLMEAIDAIANLPTGYFEAKPRRAVGFDEVRAAIIPANIDADIKEGLSERGITTYEYDPEVEGDRTAKVNDAATEQDLRFSITENSSGESLTEWQQEYFRNSKIVDADGRLKVMYHGTPNMGFTVFDLKKAKPGTLGRGFYFTDSKSHAGNHGQQMGVYLNIENPLQPDTYNITKEQLRHFVAALAEDEDYGIDNYGYDATVDSVTDSVWGRSDFQMLHDLNLTCVGDLAETCRLFNYVNGTNYDGIVTSVETLAMRPEQIKLTDNLAPTSDSDIRFSVSDDEYLSAVEKYQKMYDDNEWGWLQAEDEIQRMVDQAAVEAGYATKAYHGTDAEFNVFKRDYIAHGRLYGDGFYFSPLEEIAGTYGSNVKPYFLKTGVLTERELMSDYLAAQDYKDFADKDEALAFSREKRQQFEKYGQGIERFRPDVDIVQGMYRVIYTTVGAFQNGYIMVATEPEYIKSAEPIVRDDNGNIIPLSKRFNDKSLDTRFSIPDTDSKGNQLTDEQRHYFENSQAVDDQGRLVPVYHTTNKGGFTIFDPMRSDDHRSLFFSDDWDVSQTYGSYANSRFYYFDINNTDDIQKYLDSYSPDRYFVTQEQFDKAGGWEADFIDFENITDGKQSNFSEYLKNPDGYIAIVGVPDYSPYSKSYADTWVSANSPDELVRELHNHFGSQRDNYRMGTQHGYYACYLNLENPMIIDAKGQYWNSIKEDGFNQISVLKIGNSYDIVADGYPISFSEARSVYGDEMVNQIEEFDEWESGEYHDFYTWEGAAFNPEEEGHWPMEGNTRFWANEAEAQGYDGLIIYNLIDLGGKSEFEGDNEMSTIYIAFSPNQVKDINNENPTENPDIRYSFTDDDEAMSHAAHDYAYDTSYEALRYYESLIDTDTSTETTYEKAKKYIAKDVDEFYAGLTRYADGMKFDDPVLEEGRVRMARSKQDYFNSNIAKWNEAWLTEGEVLDPKSVKKPVRDLVTAVMQESDTTRKYKSDLVNKAIIDMRLAYFYAKQGRTDVADALLWHSAHRMIDGVEFYADDSTYEDYKGLRDYLKTTRIQLGEEYWNDADYGAFRKANFGRINLVKGSTNVDTIYQELEELFPGLFDSEEYTTPPDQLMHIAAVLDSIQPYKEAYSSEQVAELATDIASDLLDIMQNGKELQSIADKYKNRYEARVKAMKARHAEAMLKVRQQRDKGIKAEKAKFKEYVEKQREKKFHSKYFNSIEKSYKKLTERLLTNTADKNIPEQYKKELAKVLAAFDLQTVGSKKYEARTGRKGQKSIKMATLKVTLGNIENKSGEFHVSDAITDIIDELLGKNVGNGSNRSIEGLTIDELNSSELARIDKLLKALLHEFNTYKTVKINTKRQQVKDIGKAQVESALEHAKTFGAGQDYYGVKGWVDRILNMDELTPAYLFRRIDPNKEGMALMYEQLEDSHDRYIRNTVQLSEWIDEIVGEYHHKGLLKKDAGVLEEWRSENYAQDFKLENGHTITLTPAQMMSVYCLSKRAQAYNHMTGAGIVVAPVSYNAKILSDLKKKAKVALPEMLTDADIKNIVSKLDPDQVKVADKLQNLMADKMAAWGNEASMNVLGIELFGEPDYFPIKSDKAGLISDLSEDQFVEAIRSFGFTKAVQPGARNAIMVEDIFDVIAQHCNNMNLYNAYSEAINDFMKVYNYRDANEEGEYTVKQAIGHAYSQKTTNFIMSFMKDLNGNVSNGRTTGINDAFNESLARAKKASVFANIRVAAQQPTAIGRAFAVISPKYASAMLKPDRAILDEMFEHCPIAKWKSLGYYDINMGRNIEDVIMNNNNVIEEAATWAYGALDNLTWGGIWQMVKAETEDKHPKVEKGSDEYWDLCNRRMREVVAFTQVVDSPFHRSHAMRSKNFMDKLATAFGAEPTLTYNMVRDGYIRAKEMLLTGDKKGATKVFGRTMSVFVFTAGLTAAAAAFADVLRGKNPDGDDDEDITLLQKWWANTLANWKDNVNLLNNIYYVKDIMSLLDGWQINNLAFQGWKYIGTGLQQLYGSPYARSKDSWWKNMMYGVGYLTGVPVKTVMTDFGAVFNKAKSLFGFETPILDAYLESLDAIADKKDESKATTETSMWSLIKENTLDKAAEKMGYRPKEATSDNLSASTKSEGKTEKSSAETEGKTSETLSDNDALKAIEEKAEKKAAGLSGDELDTVLWDTVMEGYTKKLDAGDMDYIEHLELIYMNNGGDLEKFHAKLKDSIDSAYKKTLKDDMSKEDINNQWRMRMKMQSLGYTDQEISEICYHSEKARDLKAAMRIGVREYIDDELSVLVQAGLTREDYEKLYKYRNYGAKSYDGKYTDPKYTKTTGRFIWPTDGQITSYFGYRNAPTRGASSNHPAIDIGAPMGATVVAADGGVVIYAGTNGGYGNSVGVKHANGMVTYYNHLSAWNVKVGDQVAQGQPIANVGSTGISTGPHLDFKILDADGEPVDPLKYLASRS